MSLSTECAAALLSFRYPSLGSYYKPAPESSHRKAFSLLSQIRFCDERTNKFKTRVVEK